VQAIASEGVRSFDVRDVELAQRLSYWEDIVAETACAATFETEDLGSFHSTIKQGSFDRCTFSHVHSSAVKVLRGKKHLRASRGFCYLCLQVTGSSEIETAGRTSIAGPNSIILYDDVTPYRFRSLSPIRTVAIGVPTTMIEALLPGYHGIALRPIDGDAGINKVLLSALTTMNDLFVSGSAAHFSHSMFVGVLNLLAASLDDVTACETDLSSIARWGGKVRAFIESNLDDPDLTPASISAQFGISPRYLRLIFAESSAAENDETLRRYILRRRLEECALRLAEPASRNLSITALAFSWGFSDSSYFARCFSQQFGMTPSEYRYAVFQRRRRTVPQIIVNCTQA